MLRQAIRKEFRLEAVRMELRAQQHKIPHGAVPEDMIRNHDSVIGGLAMCMQKAEEFLKNARSMTEEDDYTFNQVVDDILIMGYVLRHCMGHARIDAKKPKIDVIEHGGHRIHTVDSS